MSIVAHLCQSLLTCDLFGLSEGLILPSSLDSDYCPIPQGE